MSFRKRTVGKSVDEWHKLCMSKFGWVCLIEERIYHILNNGICALNEPESPGSPRKCLMFRDWVKKCLAGGEEWKLIAWQESLKPLSADDATGSEVKSTSDTLNAHSLLSEWTPQKVENTLAEVAEPGMSQLIYKVFTTPSNASDEGQADQSEPLPPTSPKEKSTGIPSGATIENLLPSLHGKNSSSFYL